VVLKRVEKNQLLELIAEHDFQPSEFRLTQDDRSTIVDHASSSSRFTISRAWAPLTAEAKIGNSETLHLPDSWLDVKFEFGRWLDDVKVELDTPDLWEELRRGSELLSLGLHRDLANAPFSPTEQAQIAQQLTEIKQYVKKNCELTSEQTARIDLRFDDAEEASRRLGRKDWILLFGGALFGLVLSAVVPPEVMQHVLIMTEQGLRHLFGGGPPQLPPRA
jgi:hypothetical protein